jgi:hypothetical protein
MTVLYHNDSNIDRVLPQGNFDGNRGTSLNHARVAGIRLPFQ